MKRFAKVLVIFLALGWTTACTPSVNPPTAPQIGVGYNNQADQQMGSALSAARAFYVSIQQQYTAGTLTLTPDVKAKFNQFGQYLNAAEIIYLGYHNGVNTQAQAQTAVNQVQTSQNALPLPGAK